MMKNAQDEVKQQYERERMWETCKAEGKAFQKILFNKIKINLYPDDFLSEFILKDDFEQAEQAFVHNYLRPGDIFIDVGANIGLFTLIAAKAVGRKGRVYAFEPSPVTHKRLLENIDVNKFRNVESFQIALSDTEEDRVLTTSLDGYGAWNSLAQPTAGQQFKQEIAQCTSWDKFSLEHDLLGKVTLMKIDVEGWEFFALQGAKQTLSQPNAPDLMIEFTETNAQSAGTSCTAVYNLLNEYGYTMYTIDPEKHAVSYAPLRKSYPYLNLLATKRIDFVCERANKMCEYLITVGDEGDTAVLESGVECNICAWQGMHFNSDNWHPFTVCPSCGSEVRQRLFWAAVNQMNDIHYMNLFVNKKVLHFAPETILRSKLAEFSRNYQTADLFAQGYNYEHIDFNMDIADMRSIENETYDCVIAFDVLEHVPAHLKAIEEVNRVLKIGGYCIFAIPQKDNLEKTYEDLSITDPKDREEKFGQWDHLRIYGSDFKNMIEDRGFAVTIIDEKTFKPEIVRRNVLFPPELSKHPLATNYRKIYFGKKIRSCY
jgi:FkbM family methyltransferase